MYPAPQGQPTHPFAPRPYAPSDLATIVDSQPPRGLQLRGRRRRLRPRGLGPAALALLLGVIATLAVTSALRSSAPWPAWQSPTAHAVRVASPAVVRFVIVEEGRVTCKGCGSNGQSLTLPANGGTYSAGFDGSGAIISPDGIILTADHVIDGSSDNDTYFLADAAQELAQTSSSTAADILTSLEKQQQEGRVQVTSTVTQRTVYLSTAYFGHLAKDSQATPPIFSYNVSQVIARSPVSEHDIAIVKINAHDLPSLTLAPAGATRAQDAVTAIGFPADADLGAALQDASDSTPLLDPTRATAVQFNDLFTPTVEDGQIIAAKWLADGSLVYETTGIGNHGSSGGPVIDTQGRIVGFMDRLPDAPSTRVLELVSAETIAPFATKSGIRLGAQGAFMRQWQSAMSAYDADGYCHWTDARDTLSQLQARYPQFGAVQSYLTTARAQAANSHCVSLGGFAAASGGRMADLAQQVAQSMRSLGRTIGRLNAAGLALPFAMILLGLLIGLGLLAQPQLMKLTARGGQPQPGAGYWVRAWARETPWWGVAVEALILGAVEGFLAWAALAIPRLTSDSPLGFVIPVTAGTLAAGLVLRLLLRRYDRAHPLPPTLPAIPPAESFR